MNSETGKWIIFAGIILLLIGVVVYFFYHRLHWIGRLPGDILIEKENFRFHFPITTMIILSALATLILSIVKKIIH